MVFVYYWVPVPINWPSMNINRPPVLINQNSSGHTDNRHEKECESKTKEKDSKHQSRELFFDQIPIVLIHLLIGPSVLLVILRTVIILVLVFVSFLVEFLPGLCRSTGIVVL